MSVYSGKGRGWRYDFTLNGIRYTAAWFKTKREAMEAEFRKREELKNPPSPQPLAVAEARAETTPTDMAFLELVNRRLDYVKAYHSTSHYQTSVTLAKGWVRQWGRLTCGQITPEMVEGYILERRRVSAYTANKEIRYLKAAFNFGKRKGLLRDNPLEGTAFLPVEKRLKYVPPPEDIDKVIELAEPDIKDYLWTIRDTMGRMGEVNSLTWEDVNLEQRYVVLYTRKKRGGHLTPRKVPMTERLFKLLSRRFTERDRDKPWVFWHAYRDRKTGDLVVGPYKARPKIMKTLCTKAGVAYFRYHALRHAGASLMDNLGVPLGAIQKILGHENRKTTEIYLHSFGEAERRAITVYEGSGAQSHTSLTQSLTQDERE